MMPPLPLSFHKRLTQQGLGGGVGKKIERKGVRGKGGREMVPQGASWMGDASAGWCLTIKGDVTMKVLYL